MIVQIIGWFCLACGVISIIGSFYYFSKNKIDSARHEELAAILFFIASAICFK